MRSTDLSSLGHAKKSTTKPRRTQRREAILSIFPCLCGLCDLCGLVVNPRGPSKRAGMVGLIVVMIVLGFLALIGFSQSYLIQAEAQGAQARGYSKQAYLAAFAGIEYLVSSLRKYPFSAQTFTTVQTDDLYFCDDGSAGTNHWCTWLNAGLGNYTQYTGMTQLKAAEMTCDFTFSVNDTILPNQCTFYLCSYPGTSAAQYWAKCQGTCTAQGIAYKCQLWAELRIDYTGEMVILKRFGQMPVQTLTRTNNSANPANDFWDWESF